MIKVAVVLAGSGVKDGSEIHEATLTLYFLNELGVSYTCFAPDRDQHHVVNHLNEQEQPNEKRNILTEASRIARGDILALDQLKTNEYDAILFPGGFGAAKNLCDYAIKGLEFSVFNDVEKVIKSAHQNRKVLGFICIAPVMAAKLIPGVTVTIGSECDTSEHIKQLGGVHKVCSVDEVVWDEKNNVVSTPAYMLGPSIKDIGSGIKLLCQEVKIRCENILKSK